MIIFYKELRWRWWVAPLLFVAEWRFSAAVAGRALRIALLHGRYSVIRSV